MKSTLANLACFFFHWWSEGAGCNESTIKRLMISFYLDRYVTVDESMWDPVNMQAISRYIAAADMEDSADLDPGHKSGDVVIMSTSNEEHQALVQKLNYKETQTFDFDNVQSDVLAITGDWKSPGASSLCSETSDGEDTADKTNTS